MKRHVNKIGIWAFLSVMTTLLSSCKMGIDPSRVNNTAEVVDSFLTVGTTPFFSEPLESPSEEKIETIASEETKLFFKLTVKGKEYEVEEIALSQVENKFLLGNGAEEDAKVELKSIELRYNLEITPKDLSGATCTANSIKFPAAHPVAIECSGFPTNEAQEEPQEEEKVSETESNLDSNGTSEVYSQDDKEAEITSNTEELKFCTTGVDCNCNKEKFKECRYFNGGNGCYKNLKCNKDNDPASKDACEKMKVEFNSHFISTINKIPTSKRTKANKDVLDFAKSNKSEWCDDL